MCMFPEPSRTKSQSYSFHLQNSGVFADQNGPKGDPMKMNIENFQMQKWGS